MNNVHFLSLETVVSCDLAVGGDLLVGYDS
jgi:hypothetical protein